jgi:hypothetical protein
MLYLTNFRAKIIANVFDIFWQYIYIVDFGQFFKNYIGITYFGATLFYGYGCA